VASLGKIRIVGDDHCTVENVSPGIIEHVDSEIHVRTLFFPMPDVYLL
jgi:hypothetical protein